MRACDLVSDLSGLSKPNTSQRVEKRLRFQMVLQLLQGVPLGDSGPRFLAALCRVSCSRISSHCTVQVNYRIYQSRAHKPLQHSTSLISRNTAGFFINSVTNVRIKSQCKHILAGQKKEFTIQEGQCERKAGPRNRAKQIEAKSSDWFSVTIKKLKNGSK